MLPRLPGYIKTNGVISVNGRLPKKHHDAVSVVLSIGRRRLVTEPSPKGAYDFLFTSRRRILWARISSVNATGQTRSLRQILIVHRPGPPSYLAKADSTPNALNALSAVFDLSHYLAQLLGAFIQTNVVGTLTLLQAARAHFEYLAGPARERFCFLDVSTDEVYGSLGYSGRFTEHTAYDPHSHYSASKAASEHCEALHTSSPPAAPARPTTSAATTSAKTSTSSASSAPRSMSCGPAQTAVPTPNKSPSSPTAQATTCATPSTQPRSKRKSAGNPNKTTPTASERPSSGISTTSPGPPPSSTAPTNSNASAPTLDP